MARLTRHLGEEVAYEILQGREMMKGILRVILVRYSLSLFLVSSLAMQAAVSSMKSVQKNESDEERRNLLERRAAWAW